MAFDSDLVELSRYVEFSEDNFGCYSLEVARILLASAAEVDVVCKLLCQPFDPNADNILQYRDALVPAIPSLPDSTVELHRFGLTLRPWDEWKTTKAGNRVPFWWSDYNKVKHKRSVHFQRANLKNTLNAVAGLFVLVLHLYRDKAVVGALSPRPQILDVPHSLVSAGGVSYGCQF
jgi:hypothetical protein